MENVTFENVAVILIILRISKKLYFRISMTWLQITGFFDFFFWFFDTVVKSAETSLQNEFRLEQNYVLFRC